MDISLTSPCVVVRHDDDKFVVGCFAQRDSDLKLPVVINPEISLHIWPKIPKCHNTDIERYRFICTHIINFCKLNQVNQYTTLLVENYAFGCRQSAHSFKLYELTGLVKYMMFITFKCTDIRPVTVSSWKKQVCGHGHATKHQVLDTIQKRFGVDFMQLFGIKPRKPLTPESKVPCPIQDICDALCISLMA